MALTCTTRAEYIFVLANWGDPDRGLSLLHLPLFGSRSPTEAVQPHAAVTVRRARSCNSEQAQNRRQLWSSMPLEACRSLPAPPESAVSLCEPQYDMSAEWGVSVSPGCTMRIHLSAPSRGDFDLPVAVACARTVNSQNKLLMQLHIFAPMTDGGARFRCSTLATQVALPRPLPAPA